MRESNKITFQSLYSTAEISITELDKALMTVADMIECIHVALHSAEVDNLVD